jgi:hypothetical protein
MYVFKQGINEEANREDYDPNLAQIIVDNLQMLPTEVQTCSRLKAAVTSMVVTLGDFLGVNKC